MLQGQCIQWVLDTQSLSKIEFYVYSLIARKSFGFKNRWCYLQYEDFGMSKATVSKAIKSLKDLGIISYSHTFKDNGHRSMNEYRIMKPKAYIDNFMFNKEYKEEKTEIAIEEVMPW